METAEDDRTVSALGELSDDQLVALCLARGKGDERPFAELFRRHRQVVWRICGRYFRTPEDTADMVQVAFFRAFRALGRYSGGHPALFRAWLATIAANACKNEIRRRSRRPQLVDQPPLPDVAAAEPSVEESMIEQSKSELLYQAMAGLSAEERQILRRADLERTPYAEIAAEIGLSVSAVKMRTVRARAALAAAYRDLESQGETSREQP